MNTVMANIHRQKKYDWTPLLSFGGGLTQDKRDGYDGWFNSYNVPDVRTMGLRYKDTNGIIKDYEVANRTSYTSYDTQAGWTIDLKYDLAKLTGIYYKYRTVNSILQPFSSMPELRVMSLREHNTNFGHLDLSGNSKFSHLDVSTHWSTESWLGGSIDQITFHPDAPLKMVYISGCKIPTAVVDTCLTQCYNHRNIPAPDGVENTNSFLSQRVSWSPELQYMVDALKAMGWSGFSFY